MEENKNLSCHTRLCGKVREALGGFKPFEKKEALDFIMSSRGFKVISYRAGEIIFNKDSFEHSLGILVQGNAVIKKTKDSCSVDMKTIGKGEVFGAAALFGTHGTYASEIKAKGKETLVAFVSQSTMTSLFEKEPESAIDYIAFLSEKIRYLNERIDYFTGSDAYEKLCRYLLDNTETSISVSSLSRKLDISRSTLYRCLTKLFEKGAITRSEKTILVVDKTKLN